MNKASMKPMYDVVLANVPPWGFITIGLIGSFLPVLQVISVCLGIVWTCISIYKALFRGEKRSVESTDNSKKE